MVQAVYGDSAGAAARTEQNKRYRSTKRTTRQGKPVTRSGSVFVGQNSGCHLEQAGTRAAREGASKDDRLAAVSNQTDPYPVFANGLFHAGIFRTFSRAFSCSSTCGPRCETLPAPSVRIISPFSAAAATSRAASSND